MQSANFLEPATITIAPLPPTPPWRPKKEIKEKTTQVMLPNYIESSNNKMLNITTKGKQGK